MPKGRGGRCIHCLQWKPVVTRDHVFPASWYPESTSADIPRWTVPACKRCNERYGELERDLFLRLAACLDTEDPEFGNLAKRALRSLDPKAGRNQKDTRARQRRQERFIRDLIPATGVPTEAVFPGFGLEKIPPPGGHQGILVSPEELQIFALKLVRGIAYHFDRLYLNFSEIVFDVIPVEESIPELHSKLDRWGRRESNGPGINVTWAVAHEDSRGRMHFFEIWRKWRFYAFTRIAPDKLPDR